MIITITAGQALDKGIWDELCSLKGINVWALNEGLIDPNDEISLTEGEAISLGLIKDEK